MKLTEIYSRLSSRLAIESLNDLQRTVVDCSRNSFNDIIIYAPTGSGKTLAYVIPMLEDLSVNGIGVQAVVIAPSRELVLQIFSVIQSLAQGMKVSCCYGGHPTEDERLSLQVTPAILVSTPGRLLDHIHRGHIDISTAKWLVLDEFDKSLELGFEEEMRELFGLMPDFKRRILTSATVLDKMPQYVCLNDVKIVDFLDNVNSPSNRMTVFSVRSFGANKPQMLMKLLNSFETGKSIVFLNHREEVERMNTLLLDYGFSSGMYHGGMEQLEREKAVALFRNGSLMVLVTTDLASRGLDIVDVQHIIHYDIPLTPEVYIHRNGRTARVDANGLVYVFIEDNCPDFIQIDQSLELAGDIIHSKREAPMATLHFAAGRKEKISRGDIVGFILANSDLTSKDIGKIDIADHYALVAVPRGALNSLIAQLQKARIKGQKVRITLAKQR